MHNNVSDHCPLFSFVIACTSSVSWYPITLVMSLQLIWRSGTSRWNLLVPGLQMSLVFKWAAVIGYQFIHSWPLVCHGWSMLADSQVLTYKTNSDLLQCKLVNWNLIWHPWNDLCVIVSDIWKTCVDKQILVQLDYMSNGVSCWFSYDFIAFWNSITAKINFQ